MQQYTIGIRNLELWSPLGVHEAEQKLKVRIRINASLELPYYSHLPVALHSTVDYSKLVLMLREACSQPHMLLEQLCNDIFVRLLTVIDKPATFHIRIEKLDPMPGQNLDAAYIEVTEEVVPGRSKR